MKTCFLNLIFPKKLDSSQRYLLNTDLEKLDFHYDSTAIYKKGGEFMGKKVDDKGKERYVIEKFLYDSLIS